MNILDEFDTITAVATPLGTGGVGVMRISGRGTLVILHFQTRDPIWIACGEKSATTLTRCHTFSL